MLGIAAVITLMTGCGSMNEHDVAQRLAEAAQLNGAIVEVQHPDAPWNNKYVVWMFIDDDAPGSVADDVRRVAVFADADGDLSGKPLTLFAVVGEPEAYADGSYRLSASDVMGSVSEIVGGKGVEDTLSLSASDVSRLAVEQ